AKDISTKSLVVHDKSDKIAAVSSAYAIDKSLKNSELLITEGFGHSLYNAVVDQKIISFIKNDPDE
ncbi:MAG: alpha/beta hydrolase, partial [Psychroflexus halocasei]